jgi:hypothetical protein
VIHRVPAANVQVVVVTHRITGVRLLKVPAVGLPGDGCGAEVAEFKIWFEKVKHYAPVYYVCFFVYSVLLVARL